MEFLFNTPLLSFASHTSVHIPMSFLSFEEKVLCLTKAILQKYWVEYVSEKINKEHVQLPPPSWMLKVFNYISNDTQMVSFEFYSVTTTVPQRPKVDPSTKSVWKMQASTFKMMMKKTVSLFYDFISLGSFKKKKKRNPKKLFVYFSVMMHRCFPVNFAKFLRKPFFTEYLRWLLLNI